MTMSSAGLVSVRAIESADIDAVGEFFHEHLNRRVPVHAWRAVLDPPWGSGDSPNRGFQLVEDGVIVGAYAAIYSTRPGEGGDVEYCNLAAFCVLEGFRAHALRLLRAVLGQRKYVFTDLSPSGNVPELNDRLGFSRLDTSTRLVLNAPGLPRRGVTLSEHPDVIARTLQGSDAEIYRDHRKAPASRHLVVRRGDEYAYLMYRRDRRKRVSGFASPLYVGGDPTLLKASWSKVATHLLRRGMIAVLAEQRVLGFTPRGLGRTLGSARPKMVKNARDSTTVDYLYSELTLLEW